MDISLSFRNWNQIWKEILVENRKELSSASHHFGYHFLHHMNIQQASYLNYRQSFLPTEDNYYEESFFHTAIISITAQTKENTYVIYYNYFYDDDGTVFRPNFFLYEGDVKIDGMDFFQYEQDEESFIILVNCLKQLFLTIHSTYRSYLNKSEVKQSKKNYKRLYGKNKITKYHKKFYK